MEQGQLSWIANFIWGIADDVLRDLYVRGKYRDVILPMMVLRRLDAVLEPTKKAVLELKTQLDRAGVANQDAALRQAAGQAFDFVLIVRIYQDEDQWKEGKSFNRDEFSLDAKVANLAHTSIFENQAGEGQTQPSAGVRPSGQVSFLAKSALTA